MHRDYFDNTIEGMDLRYGICSHEAVELGNKCWLSGGRVVRNKKTWYAHWRKGRFKDYRYSWSKKAKIDGSIFCIDFWMNNKWDKQVHDIKWMVDKFAPVPGWEGYQWA